MRFEIKAGEQLDVLTQDELRTVLGEVLSGYLRSPYRVRFVEAGTTDADGDVLIANVAQARAGFELRVLRLTILVDGYSFSDPYSPAEEGAVTLIRGGAGIQAGDEQDGFGFGGSSGESLPVVYTESEARAFDLRDQETLQVQVAGGPASTGVTIFGHGLMIPLPPE